MPERAVRGRRGRRGSIPISTTLGLAAFVGFLLLAVQVLVHLYATSAVTAAAYDAARTAASFSARERPATPRQVVSEAEERARQVLGRYGGRARFDWSGSDDDSVVVRVHVPNPNLLPASLARAAGMDDVDRTVRVRLERLR